MVSAIRLKEEKKEERWDRTEKEGKEREEIKGIQIGNKEAKPFICRDLIVYVEKIL